MAHLPRLSRSLLCLCSVLTPACGSGGKGDQDVVAVDGSSTVYPVSEAVAEEFQKTGKGRVTIGVSGTGGGFKKFCKGEIVISGASRPIKPSEVELCKSGNVEYIELPVAYDGIAIVVHPDNDWAETMTVAELEKLWAPAAQRTVTKWSDVRPEWPSEEIHLFGPGVDSGTYDYFTAAIVGQEHASRGDFTSSEDDNVLVQGVEGDRYSLGYFGFAYYWENQERLRAVAVDGGSGCVMPTDETINTNEYAPLSRPLFIYVNRASLERPAVQRFVEFYLRQAAELVPQVGYIALPAADYQAGLDRLTGPAGG
jgi:phosphate transport system substrate-binding protein